MIAYVQRHDWDAKNGWEMGLRIHVHDPPIRATNNSKMPERNSHFAFLLKCTLKVSLILYTIRVFQHQQCKQ